LEREMFYIFIDEYAEQKSITKFEIFPERIISWSRNCRSFNLQKSNEKKCSAVNERHTFV